MADRVGSLNNLLTLALPISIATTELASWPWDSDVPLATLLPEHIVSALNKFNAGALSSSEVEAWANAVECREDIEYSPSSPAGIALHELANPFITRLLTPQSAQALIATLSGNVT